MGLTVEVEVAFPPKSVDCYLPDYHLAVEADGPQHSLSKDIDRDSYLMTVYALPVVRISSKVLARSKEHIIVEFCKQVLEGSWGITRADRRMFAWYAGVT